MLITSTFKGFGFIKKLLSSINSVVQDYKLVIIIPDNLPLSRGKLAVSCSHAAVLCYIEASKKAPMIANAWLRVGQKKIVLKWDRGLPELINLSKSANEQNIVSVVVRDAGMTEVTRGTVTAVGIGPASSEEIDMIVPKLKLM